MTIQNSILVVLVATIWGSTPADARYPYDEAPSVLSTQKEAREFDAVSPAAPAAAGHMPKALVSMVEAEPASDSDEPASDSPSTSAAGELESSSPIVESMPVYRYAPVNRRSQGLLGELMELERRKNAWLRRTFIGR